MGMPYAEVIGDPIAQSKSPLIHKYWLEQSRLEGDYRATRVPREDLAVFLSRRRDDSDWRGCNVTIPHKEAVIPLLDALSQGARAIGAVNCVVREGERLVGHNSDIDGVAAALDAASLEGRKAVVIGAGGGARAALHYLALRKAAVTILVRSPDKAALLLRDGVEIFPLGQCEAAMAGAAAIINASPMGMNGAAPMPPELLACISTHSRGATVFDMVYAPLETALLAAARAHGGNPVDGLAMLIGQAAAAFRLFFGRLPRADYEALRNLLLQ